MRKYILAALLAGTAATPAFAQEEASPFTGFRIEGLAGYDVLKSGEQDDGTETDENEGDESIEGISYGVAAGFDFDLGGVVAGIEAEFAESTGEQDFNESVDAPFAFSIQTGRDLYVGGRLGVTVAPSTLVYAKAGYTKTKIDALIEDETENFDFDGKVDGWRLGAGIEQLFGPNMYGKLEYRYSKYGDLKFADDTEEVDIDLDRHQVLAGIGFRF